MLKKKKKNKREDVVVECRARPALSGKERRFISKLGKQRITESEEIRVVLDAMMPLGVVGAHQHDHEITIYVSLPRIDLVNGKEMRVPSVPRAFHPEKSTEVTPILAIQTDDLFPRHGDGYVSTDVFLSVFVCEPAANTRRSSKMYIKPLSKGLTNWGIVWNGERYFRDGLSRSPIGR